MKDRYIIKILIKNFIKLYIFYSTSKIHAHINYYFSLIKKKYNFNLFIYYVIHKIYDSDLNYINFKYLFKMFI